MTENDKALQDQVRAALTLNYCTVSVSQIIDYKDVYILEHEYNAIINNLNMEQCLSDEALKRMFNRMLDVITRFRIQEGDRKWLRREYENNMKNALFNCLPGMNVIVAGGNPWTLLISAAHQVGVSYFNYRKNKNQYQMQKKKGEWELTKGAWESFNQLRKELFNAQWDMTKAYKIPDQYLLKEEQLEEYNAILLDDDPRRKMEQLEYVEKYFRAFPPFWFNRAQAAGDAARIMAEEKKVDQAQLYRTEKIKCLDTFNGCWMPILRSDVFAYSSDLERIRELDRVADRDKIVSILDRIAEHARLERDVMQICALEYLGAGEQGKAERLLKWMVNGDYNVPLNGRILSSLYVEANRNAEYKILAERIGEENVCPPGKRLVESLDGQKARLTDDCQHSSQELAGKCGIMWANISFYDVNEILAKYADPGFDDVDEILTYFEANSVKDTYAAGVKDAAEFFKDYPLLAEGMIGSCSLADALLTRCNAMSDKYSKKLTNAARKIKRLGGKAKEANPDNSRKLTCT